MKTICPKCNKEIELIDEIESNGLITCPNCDKNIIVVNSPQSFKNGSMIGQCKIIRFLKLEKNSEVYEVEHIIFEESFTLIVFPKELSDNSLDLKLIESKYSQISKIKHNNILFLYEFGEDKDCFWIRIEKINLINNNIITLTNFAKSKN